MKKVVKFLSLLTFFLILSSRSDDDDGPAPKATTVVGSWVQTKVSVKYENPSNGNTIERLYDLTDLCDPKPVAVFQENGELTCTDVMIDANTQQEITCESTNVMVEVWEKVDDSTYNPSLMTNHRK